jgi:heptosyltransferase-3
MRKKSDLVYTVVISRTDSLGDVMLTLPMAGIIKKHIPNSRIIFLGRTYSKSVIQACEHVDEFVSWDDLQHAGKEESLEQLMQYKADAILHVFPNKYIARLARKAGIPVRAGTSHRIFHLTTCTHRISFSRRNSDLHESQLNLKLLSAIGIQVHLSLPDIAAFTGFTRIAPLEKKFSDLLAPDKFNLILHPRSKGSAREWGLDNFTSLIALLPKDKYKIFISGTAAEGDSMREFFKMQGATDLTGQMNLSEFISFIANANGLVAASTGPLHIAAALDKKAIGLFAPMQPIHPGRWAPIGPDAHALVLDKACNDCRRSGDCHCIREISALQVSALLH